MVSTFSGRWVGTNSLSFAHPRIVVSGRAGSSVRMIERALRNAGAIVDVVDAVVDANGVIYLDPDLVVIDVDAPPPDPATDPGETADRFGPELVRTIHAARTEVSFVPIVALVDDHSATARDDLLQNGADEVVLKPFDLVELFLRLDRLLEVRHRQVTLQADNTDLRVRLDDALRERDELRLSVDELRSMVGGAGRSPEGGPGDR